VDRVNLDDPRIMAAKEACKKWKIDDSTLRKRIADFPSGTIKKFGKQWVVTQEGMETVFGKLKEDE
jgi:hypothetical protein